MLNSLNFYVSDGICCVLERYRQDLQVSGTEGDSEGGRWGKTASGRVLTCSKLRKGMDDMVGSSGGDTAKHWSSIACATQWDYGPKVGGLGPLGLCKHFQVCSFTHQHFIWTYQISVHSFVHYLVWYIRIFLSKHLLRARHDGGWCRYENEEILTWALSSWPIHSRERHT